jgi:hypothetical protein
MNAPATSDQYAIVELFGHARIAGRISEQTVGGQSFVRIDVPTIVYEESPGVTGRIAAHTRSFGAGAIYSINWCDEGAAALAAQSIKHQPINPYRIRDALRDMPDHDRQRLLAGPVASIQRGGGGAGDAPF